MADAKPAKSGKKAKKEEKKEDTDKLRKGPRKKNGVYLPARYKTGRKDVVRVDN